MKKIFILLFFIFSLITSCTKKEEAKVIPKTGVELVAIGAINFGGLIVGQTRDAAIKIYNFGPNDLDTSNIINVVSQPFYVQSISSGCSTGTLKAGSNCIIAIRFAPTLQGEYTNIINIGGASIETTGRGMIDGVMTISETEWNIGDALAGSEFRQTVTISNNGDFTIQSPTVILPQGLSIGFNNCGSYINTRTDCNIELVSNKIIKGIYNEIISFQSGNQILNMSLKVNIVPAEPAGIITFINPPSKIIADGSTEIQINTDLIKDRFGNIVADGTNVSVNGTNLNILSGNTQQTINGKVSFVLRSTAQRGTAIATIVAGEAVGVLRLQAQSGDPYGLITLESFNPNIIANGTSQIVFRTMPLLDTNGNMIEDNTDVFIELNGIGVLSTPIAKTLLGSVSFVITAPSSTGSAILKLKSGPIYDTNNNIIDYKAKGEYQLYYVPDYPFGTIAVNPTYKGIYYIEDFSIEQSGINVRSQVVIGPVRDSKNNIVAANTPIEVAVSNGKLLYQSSNPSVFYTDSNGYVYATVAGNGSSGKINITASHFKGASGANWIWAFLDQTLRYSPLSNNKVFMYEKIYADNQLPSINEKWSEVFDYSGIDISDNKNQYGLQIDGFELSTKNTKNLIVDNVPYLLNTCWTTNNNYLILAPCLKNEDFFNEGPYSYDLFVNNNISKNTSMSVDKNITKLHTTHSDSLCDQYNDHYIDLNILKNNCEDKSKGGIQCRFDETVFDAVSMRFGVCVSKPLLASSYSYNEEMDQLLIFGGSNKQKLISNDLSMTEIYNFFNFDKYVSIYSGLSRQGIMASSMNQTGNESFEEVGDFPKDFLANENNFSCNLYSLPSLCASVEGANCKWDDNSFSCIESAPSEGIAMMEFAQKNNFHYGFGGYNQNIDCSIFTNENKCDNILGNHCTWNNQSNICENTDQNFSVDYPNMYEFNGLSKKWATITISGDPNEYNESSSPSSRYQHGMLYVPVNNSIYIAGGLRKFTCDEMKTQSMCSLNQTISSQCSWNNSQEVCEPKPGKPGSGWLQGSSIGTGEIWKVSLDNLGLNQSGQLNWEKICGSQKPTIIKNNVTIINPAYKACNIPATYSDLDAHPEQSAVKTSLIWNPLRQKIYMYVSNSLSVLEIDPYTNDVSLSSNANVLSALDQVIYNKKTGRTIGYYKGNNGSSNGKLYSWDLGINEKKYYQVIFKIGQGSNEVANLIRPIIRGYGYIKDASNNIVSSGIISYIWNNTANSWELMGENTANYKTQMDGQEIYKDYNQSVVSKYINNDGDVKILITNKGSPISNGKLNLIIDKAILEGNF